MEVRISAGEAYRFSPGTIRDGVLLDNRHNVAGSVIYQIGAEPPVDAPIKPNTAPLAVRGVNGRQLFITNKLPSSLYVVF